MNLYLVVFTMEDFLAEDEEFARKIGDDGLKADIEGGTSSVTRHR
jgi:hypothetical protein